MPPPASRASRAPPAKTSLATSSARPPRWPPAKPHALPPCIEFIMPHTPPLLARSTGIRLAMALLLLLLLFSTACKNARLAPPLSDEEVATFTEGQPQVFVPRGGALGFDEFESLY